MRSIRASEFKAKCLAILDDVERTGEPITILKRGRPVARLVPPARGEGKYPQDTLKGTVKILGDVLEPVLPAEMWEAEGGEADGRRFSPPTSSSDMVS
ncbi:MAG TPA: type II toxin-antitoxin system prevent-host-death family antitoxin [Thermoanaerobaculia bacterium]|jgi:prevent-host-death family protein|nr:type II toxin-antitoxin system prevent-host-death family antitoxin [Thermoanaerobaculia bacterium]